MKIKKLTLFIFGVGGSAFFLSFILLSISLILKINIHFERGGLTKLKNDFLHKFWCQKYKGSLTKETIGTCFQLLAHVAACVLVNMKMCKPYY